MNEIFRKFADRSAEIAGSSWTFLTAAAAIVVWLASGPFFKFSDTWQLIINTSTTIITFLMVFLIQNTQNRDAKAMQLKLDELIRTTKDARDTLIDVEHLSDEQLRHLQESFRQLSEKHGEVMEDYQRAVEGEMGERVKK